jgi:hypothetical protein
MRGRKVPLLSGTESKAAKIRFKMGTRMKGKICHGKVGLIPGMQYSTIIRIIHHVKIQGKNPARYSVY